MELHWDKNGDDHPIVFEAKGKDGKRLVAFHDPIECSREDYEKYLSGKLKPKSVLAEELEIVNES